MLNLAALQGSLFYLHLPSCLKCYQLFTIAYHLGIEVYLQAGMFYDGNRVHHHIIIPSTSAHKIVTSKVKFWTIRSALEKEGFCE